MNKVIMIGNLVADPESRTTSSGVSLCEFRIAVNRQRSQSAAAAGQPDADFVRVTAWRQLGDLCKQYLAKGRKVAVTGTVGCSAYIGKDGQPHASMEVTADNVEFLTPKSAGPSDYAAPVAPAMEAPAVPQGNSYTQVDNDELPF